MHGDSRIDYEFIESFDLSRVFNFYNKFQINYEKNLFNMNLSHAELKFIENYYLENSNFLVK